MENNFWLPFIKLLHISGLILWLGPSGGAWLLVQLSKRRLQQDSREFNALYRDFVKFFWIEHFGLLLLLLSGILLVMIEDFTVLGAAWIQIKLVLIVFVLLPIEALDIWFGHVRLPGVFAPPDRNNTVNRTRRDVLRSYEQRFAPIALPILLVTVVVIMWLAIAKQI